MGLENLRAREQISATDMRNLARQVQRSRPALGSPKTVVSSSGGTASVKDDDTLFLVKITAVTGTGSSAVYSFVEQNVVPAAGGLTDGTSPRRADKDLNPGRCVVSGVTLAIDGIAQARRNPAAMNEWEVYPLAESLGIGSEPCGGSFAGIPGYVAGAAQFLGKDTSNCLTWFDIEACP